MIKNKTLLSLLFFALLSKNGVASMPSNNVLDSKNSQSTEVIDFYKIQVESIEGKSYLLSDYKGKVVLVVNTASACGYTVQYKGLEELYEKYKDKGLVVLGMPCNQFGKQEPGTEKEIKKFCELRFGVKFPLLKKADVNGKDRHPLYRFLLSMSTDKNDIHWNFEKFLVSKEGTVLNRFHSSIKPEDKELISEIEKAL
jgi:glutathione peroxidase